MKNIGELVKLAKVQPGKLDYASAGLGTVTFQADLLIDRFKGR